RPLAHPLPYTTLFRSTFGGFEYHCAICASSALSQVSGRLNQSSSNAIKSPSICVVKSFVFPLLMFVKLSPLFRFVSLVDTSPCNFDVFRFLFDTNKITSRVDGGDC